MVDRLVLKSLIGTAVVVAAVTGAWVYKREDDCQRLLSSSDPQSDVEVRRTTAGVCYPCRFDGPLYDIAYRYCAAEDRVYGAP